MGILGMRAPFSHAGVQKVCLQQPNLVREVRIAWAEQAQSMQRLPVDVLERWSLDMVQVWAIAKELRAPGTELNTRRFPPTPTPLTNHAAEEKAAEAKSSRRQTRIRKSSSCWNFFQGPSLDRP